MDGSLLSPVDAFPTVVAPGGLGGQGAAGRHGQTDGRADPSPADGAPDTPEDSRPAATGDGAHPVRGTVLGGYRIVRLLYRGALASVHLAVPELGDVGGGDQVAVKVVDPRVLAQGVSRQRFLREAGVGREVEHPNLARTLAADVAEAAGLLHHFLVLEYVEGLSLRHLLREQGQLPERLVVHVAAAVARGLAALHDAGGLHRDLRPENVLLTREDAVKLMEPGLSRPVGEASGISRTGLFVGSVEYASPEQFGSDEDQLTPAADLYSLGILIHELATGRRPFHAPDVAGLTYCHLHEKPAPPSAARAELSAFLDELVGTLLAKRPNDRFPSAGAVADALEQGEASNWWKRRLRRRRSSSDRPAQSVPVRRSVALVGRERELGELQEAFERVRHGSGALVLVEGDPGIGKTRLLDEFVRRMQGTTRAFRFAYGGYAPGDSASATGAFVQAFRELLAGDSLDTALRRHLADATGLAPRFARLLEGEGETEGAFERDAVQSAFVQVTRSIAKEQPLILAIDDLHFTNPAGLALFSALVHAIRRHPVLLIGTHRAGALDAWVTEHQRHEHVARLLLPRLDVKELSRLLVECLGSHASGVGLGVRVAAKSEGNPYFVFEILRSLQEQGLLRRDGSGTLRSTTTIRDLPVPPSVSELLGARLDRLDAGERQTLAVASCLGHEFDPTVVAEIEGEPLLPFLRRLGRMEHTHALLRSAGTHFAFDHHLLHETLYARLPADEREVLHRRIAEVLSARVQETGGEASVDIARHFFRGGRAEETAAHLEPALDHLEATYRHDEAIALCDAALIVDGVLEGARRAAVILRKAERHGIAEQHHPERVALEQARDLAVELGDDTLVARAALLLGRHHVGVGEPDDARRRLSDAVAIAKRADAAALEAEAQLELGQAFEAVRDFPKSKQALERCLELAEQLGNRTLECRARIRHGLALEFLGRQDESTQEVEAGLSLARRLGDGLLAARACGALGVLYGRRGKMKEAEEFLVRHREQARRLGDRRDEGLASARLGSTYRAQGKLQEAAAEIERALELAYETGDKRGEAAAATMLGNLFRAQGNLDRSQACHERHIDICRRLGDERGQALGFGNVANLLVQRGRYGEALENHRNHLAACRKLGFRRGEASALLNLGTLLAKLGDPETADGHLRDSLDVSEVIGDHVAVGVTQMSRGAIAAQCGRMDVAENHFDRALQMLTRTRSRPQVAAALLGLASVQLDGQRLEEARESLDQALEHVRAVRVPPLEVAAITMRARLPGGNPSNAAQVFRKHEPRLGVPARLQALRNLWFATGDARYRTEARSLLDAIVAHAPEEYRESMVENVPQYRAVLKG